MKQLRNSQQRNVKPQPNNIIHKQEPSRNFRLQNTILEIKTQCMGSTVKWTEERKRAVNLKTSVRKLITLICTIE